MISSDVEVLGQITLNIIDSSDNSTHFIFLDHRKIRKFEKVVMDFRKSKAEKSRIGKMS